MNLNNISNDPRVNQWFELGSVAESTRVIYGIYIRFFCECAGKTPSELIEESINETKAGLLISERNTGDYLTKFKKLLNEKKYAPKTQALAISTVKSFYKAFDIQLPSSLCRVRKTLPQRENQNFLTRKDIIKLVTNAKNLREKAIILCMASSGMARAEIISLRVKDITYDANNIGTVRIRREKAQVDYTTFISPEATQAIRNYFDERNRDPETGVKSKNDYVFVTYGHGSHGGKGGKLCGRTFLKNFNELGKQLGYGNGEGFLIKSRSHALRKYFASTLENAGMPKNKIDFMLGHTPNGNDLAYFQTDIEKLRDLYIKYLPVITFEKTIEVRSLDTKDAERLETLEKENEKLKTEIQGAQELKDRMTKRDVEVEELKKQMELVLKAYEARTG
ncbi:MAG: tyrosine-type recombinase/integrase [Candidatus Methanoperedens sp.]|nr:tyrosine-type recombinase/integrase [Candidatus Methanoperedens sp.]